VTGKLQDGQLSNCPLTLKDIDNIIESFSAVLKGVFHERIEYPDMNISKRSVTERTAADRSLSAEGKAEIGKPAAKTKAECAGKPESKVKPECAEKAESKAKPECTEKAENKTKPECTGKAEGKTQPECAEKAEGKAKPECTEKAEVKTQSESQPGDGIPEQGVSTATPIILTNTEDSAKSIASASQDAGAVPSTDTVAPEKDTDTPKKEDAHAAAVAD